MSFGFFAKKKRVIVFGSIIAIILLLIISASIVLNSKGFYRGISIEGIDVSGLSREKAKILINSEIEKLFGSKKIILKYGENVWVNDFNDISMNFLVDEAIDKAYKIGRTGNILSKLFNIVEIKKDGAFYFSEISFDRTVLKSILNELKQQIDRKEKSATVMYENGSITFAKEEIGRILDVDENLKMIENNIERRNFQQINLIVRKKYPKVLFNDLKSIQRVIGDFSTIFNSQDYNRSYNIKLACEKISGIVVFPREIFSMNEALGPRTPENGYKEAPVIFKNELVKGTGGGVCQVTTTLYNVVLKSKLSVCSRTHHSIPLGYVKPGLDATIAENYIDFKFMNNTDYPVCISANVKNNSVNIAILGKKDKNEFKVVLKSVITQEIEPEGEEIIIDSSVPDNEKITVREARKGYKAIVYRETYNKNGELIDKEKISEDIYAPSKAQVKVNQNYSDSENITT